MAVAEAHTHLAACEDAVRLGALQMAPSELHLYACVQVCMCTGMHVYRYACV